MEACKYKQNKFWTLWTRNGQFKLLLNFPTEKYKDEIFTSTLFKKRPHLLGWKYKQNKVWTLWAPGGQFIH